MIQTKDSEAVCIQSKYRLKTQKIYKRLKQTEDAELHKRYVT